MRFDQGDISIVTLLRRYKRFLVDVIDENGQMLTVHCPNTGSMLGCREPGSQAAISRSNNPARKYPHTLEMVRENNAWVGVNTARANHLVVEALAAGVIDGFDASWQIQREVAVTDGSRLDFRLRRGGEEVYLEVKNCSLAVAGRAFFPDAVTERGRRHLTTLISLKKAGHGAVIFFLVQSEDAHEFAPADHIDPNYGQALRQAAENGVTVMAYGCAVSPQGIEIIRALPCIL
ncbi:MAG: DNA/RNA nuclease SfsA [Desulfobulbaceae bacterium]|jgi:sugar fermentation stimulation protein A|nr:DNA/RNA nuclease SfsA [Desulfobulbaceae bacterium]